MGTNTLETEYENGDTIDAAHVNELTQAMVGTFVGRGTDGVPALGKSLGSLALPWGNIYASGLILDEVAIDTSLISASPNRIVSGKTRTLSDMPDFLRADGAALEFDLLGLSTNLVVSINNSAVTVSTDITKTGFTAAPSSNNTCAVNDATMSNDKYAGEEGTEIIIGTVGTEISSRVGQVIALSNGTEIMMGYVKSATVLSNVKRGLFFDSAGAPLVRANLSNTSTLTILSLGWVFVEDNGTTVDVSYRTPVVSYSSPSSPTTGDYWYDLSNNVWNRYSGASFEIINRILIGVIAANTTACLGARCFDFSNGFSELNNVIVEVSTTEIVKTKNLNHVLNVYGTVLSFINTFPLWNITTNLESPLVEASSTMYYLYISTQGQTVISTERPYHRPDLHGYYHPYHSWRCLGDSYNDGSSNIVFANSYKYNVNYKPRIAVASDTKTSGTAGGGSSTGSFLTRTLNTLSDPDGIIIALTSNQLFLAPGKYFFEASAPQYQSLAANLKLRNITTSADELLSTTEYCATAATNTKRPFIVGEVIIKNVSALEVQYRVSGAKATDGLGVPSSFGTEVYTISKISRIG
jgi:hypothetical protein